MEGGWVDFEHTRSEGMGGRAVFGWAEMGGMGWGELRYRYCTGVGDFCSAIEPPHKALRLRWPSTASELHDILLYFYY